MSWGLGWKRSSDTFHLTLSYGADVETLEDSSPRSSRSSSSASAASSSFSPSSTHTTPFHDALTGNGINNQNLGFRIDLDWTAGDDEDQTALKLQSQVMVQLPSPQDMVEVDLKERGGIRLRTSGNVVGGFGNSGNVGGQSLNSEIIDKGSIGGEIQYIESVGVVDENVEERSGGGGGGGGGEGMGDVEVVEVEMRVVKRRDPLRGVVLWRNGTSGQQIDGMGVLLRLMRSNISNQTSAVSGEGGGGVGVLEGVVMGCGEHWQSVTVVSLCGLGLAVSNSWRSC